MHFSIPDTQECKDDGGSSYTSYNLYINGVFHCSVRYNKFHQFHEQLKKEFGAQNLPPFPPKKFLSLTPPQIDERRAGLEHYVQLVSQEPHIASAEAFNNFLLTAQQETQKEPSEQVTLDVFLMNGHQITVHILSTDQTEDVLEAVASQIQIPDEFVYYFGLFLVKKVEHGDSSIVRMMQDFESPHISLKAANKEGSHRVVLRKSYWDSAFDDDLLDNKVTMNLLYVQAQNDLQRGWVWASKEQKKHLETLAAKGSKREYLRLARTLKYYGFLQFPPCITNYPSPHSRVLVAAGNKELNFRVQVGDQIKEGIFKITRMRCWRITTSYPVEGEEEEEGQGSPGQGSHARLDLSFEYLMSKDKLQWIAITSDQAMLMSMCLRSMVDELIMKKQGRKFKRPQDRGKKGQRSLMKRDNSSTFGRVPASAAETQSPTEGPMLKDGQNEDQSAINKAMDSMKKISDKFSKSSLKSPENGVTGNEVFEGIGDDDL